MVLSLGMGLPFVNPGVRSIWSAPGMTIGGGIVTVVSVHHARWCTSPLGVVPAGLGDGVGDCHGVANLPRVCLFISLVYLFGRTSFTLFSRV